MPKALQDCSQRNAATPFHWRNPYGVVSDSVVIDFEYWHFVFKFET